MNKPSFLIATFVAVGALTSIVPRSAHADDEARTRVTYASGAELEVGPEVAALATQGAGFGIGASLLFGIDRRWSAGITGSVLVFPYSSVDAIPSGNTSPGAPFVGPAHVINTYRFDGEARYHPILGRYGDMWLGVGGGAGAAQVVGYGTTAGPHLGAAAGVDVRPFPFFSLGFHARGGGYLLSIPGEGSGLYPEATLGIILGFHVPKMGDAQPARSVAAR